MNLLKLAAPLLAVLVASADPRGTLAFSELDKPEKHTESTFIAPGQHWEPAGPILMAEPGYSERDLLLLSQVIQAEAGSDCCTDEHQQLVGMVVLNRVSDPRFPDTIDDVIFQPGQYACVDNGTFWLEPSDRAVVNAVKVLTGQVDCPENVVFQAEFAQGDGIYKICESSYSTTYFCYLEG